MTQNEINSNENIINITFTKNKINRKKMIVTNITFNNALVNTEINMDQD